MDKNEAKKMVYKTKPVAEFSKIRLGVAYYKASSQDHYFEFEIPVDDMGDADFFPTMDAKLLLRWLV